MSGAVKIGILYSTTGPYGTMGRDCRDGAELAIEEIAASHPGRIEPVFIDPEANIDRYLEGARSLLRDHGCRHIIGTITSLARRSFRLSKSTTACSGTCAPMRASRQTTT